MGNRYGRNQKRKAREKISLLEHQIRMEKLRVKDIERATDAIRQNWCYVAETIMRTLGPNSLLAFLSAEYIPPIPAMGPKGTTRRVTPRPDFDFNVPVEKTATDAMMSINPIAVSELIAHFKRDFRGQAVASFSYSDHTSCLAVSESALQAMPRRVLIEEVAKQLVQHMDSPRSRIN